MRRVLQRSTLKTPWTANPSRLNAIFAPNGSMPTSFVSGPWSYEPTTPLMSLYGPLSQYQAGFGPLHTATIRPPKPTQSGCATAARHNPASHPTSIVRSSSVKTIRSHLAAAIPVLSANDFPCRGSNIYRHASAEAASAATTRVSSAELLSTMRTSHSSPLGNCCRLRLASALRRLAARLYVQSTTETFMAEPRRNRAASRLQAPP